MGTDASADDAGPGEVGSELFTRPDNIVSDCNLVARFPIKPKLRARAVQVVSKIALGKDYRPRERLAAIKCLVAMDKMNQADEVAGKGGQLTVNIVNQANAGVIPEGIGNLSDADLERIAATGIAGIIASEGGTSEPP